MSVPEATPQLVQTPYRSISLPSYFIHRSSIMSSSGMYAQGHTKAVLKGHAARTVENSAGFLVPHIKPTDVILDIGCGPCSIVSRRSGSYIAMLSRSLIFD